MLSARPISIVKIPIATATITLAYRRRMPDSPGSSRLATLPEGVLISGPRESRISYPHASTRRHPPLASNASYLLNTPLSTFTFISTSHVLCLDLGKHKLPRHLDKHDSTTLNNTKTRAHAVCHHFAKENINPRQTSCQTL